MLPSEVLFERLLSEQRGQNNLAFASLFQIGDANACVDLLAKTQRMPEAALFARTYTPRYVIVMCSSIRTTVLMGFPSKIPEIVDAWRSELRGKGRAKLASAIASPTEHESLFEEGWTDGSSVA